MDRRGGHYDGPLPGDYSRQPGYQLDDNPFSNSQAAIDMPLQPPPGRYGTPSDHLALNAAVRLFLSGIL